MAAALAALVCLLLASGAGAGVLAQVRATGLGAIVGGDRAAAFAEAKKAALREAVEEGVGTLVTARTRVENFALIEDDILTHTEGYVRSFEIVEQGPIDEQTYRVTVEAAVELGALHERLDALELLIESAGNPYILCVGDERYEFGEAERPLLAAALRAAFERHSGRFNIMVSAAGAPAAGIESAARWALSQGADIAILGTARVQAMRNVPIPYAAGSLAALGLHGAAAALRVEALWTDTGEVFASASRLERAAASTPWSAAEKAVRQGADLLADSLVAALVENWRQKVYSGRLVRVVAQVESADLPAFERAFPLVVGDVDKIYRRSYRDGVATFDVRSKKSAFDMARHLSSKGIEAFDIAIEQVTPNSLKLRAASAP